MSEVGVALLRGINVGRAKRIGMAPLRELFAQELGFTDVRTHLQSGNVIFAGGGEDAARRISEAIGWRFGFEVDVLVRSSDALAALVEANPLGGLADDPARQLVVFLSAEPGADRAQGIEALDVTPDVLRLAGCELHIWCPAGVRNSRAAKLVLPRELGVWGTARNWRTVERLFELCSSA